MFVPNENALLGKTHQMAYREMSDEDKSKEIMNMARTGALMKTVEKGYKEHLAFNQLRHKEEMEMAEIAQKQAIEANELAEERNGLIIDQNDKLSEISNIMYQQNMFLFSGLHNISANVLAMMKVNSITNDNLSRMIELMEVPEYEIERMYHFKEGCTYMNEALKNPRRMDDAVDFFNKAYKVNRRDPLTTNKLGNCYTYSAKHLDLDKAKTMFELSIDYGITKFEKGNAILSDSYANLMYVKAISLDFDGIVPFAKEAIEYAGNNVVFYKALGLAIYNLLVFANDDDTQVKLGGVAVDYLNKRYTKDQRDLYINIYKAVTSIYDNTDNLDEQAMINVQHYVGLNILCLTHPKLEDHIVDEGIIRAIGPSFVEELDGIAIREEHKVRLGIDF